MTEFDKNRSPLMIGSTEKFVEPPTLLRDFLTRVLITWGDRRANDMPKQIDLGEFDDIVNHIIDLTKKDPQHREHGVAVLCNIETNNFSILKPIQGDELSIESSIEFRYPDIFAFDIHSHGDMDIPFSSLDVSTLFPRPGVEDVAPVTILVTPYTKMLIARTEETIGKKLRRPTYDMDTLNPEKRMFALTRLAQENKLKIYSGSRKNNVLTQAC